MEEKSEQCSCTVYHHAQYYHDIIFMAACLSIDVIAENVKAEIVASARMSYTPELFAVDCLPYEENTDEKERSLEVRKALLSCIFSQEAVLVKNVMVVKPRAIMEEDTRKVRGIKGILEGYNSRLEEVKANATAALNESKAHESTIAGFNSTISSYRQRMSQLDTDELVAVKHRDVTQSGA